MSRGEKGAEWRERERNNRPPLLSLIHFTSQLASCWHEVLVLSAHFKLRGFGQVTSYLSFSSLLYRTGLVRAINLRGCWKLEWDHGNVIRPLRMGVMKPKGPFLHPTQRILSFQLAATDLFPHIQKGCILSSWEIGQVLYKCNAEEREPQRLGRRRVHSGEGAEVSLWGCFSSFSM